MYLCLALPACQKYDERCHRPVSDAPCCHVLRNEICVLINQHLGHRLVTLASGAAAGKFLQYEAVAPTVAAQTAYGIECEVRQTRPADLS